eukprot:365130-Chlamydomonas_euryale.AAC.32
MHRRAPGTCKLCAVLRRCVRHAYPHVVPAAIRVIYSFQFEISGFVQLSDTEDDANAWSNVRDFGDPRMKSGGQAAATSSGETAEGLTQVL